MEMKLRTFKEDFIFGKVEYTKPGSEEDMEQGIDAWLGDVPIAWRRRRISVNDYGEISIRYKRTSGAKTEYDKLLDGSFKALIFIFQFTDAVVICLTEDIVQCLKENKFTKCENPDGKTSVLYVEIDDIPHLMLRSEP